MTEEQKTHSPEPWTIDRDLLNYQSYINPEFPDAYAGCIKSDDNMVVAIVTNDNTPGDVHLSLLSAAPDMLEALEDIVEQAEATQLQIGPDLADAIRVFGKTAIAKARGHTEKTDIEMVEVVSSNIQSVGYDRDENVLQVSFHGGALYRYKNVPENIYQGLLEAGSPGAFFFAQVKGKYEYEKVG